MVARFRKFTLLAGLAALAVTAGAKAADAPPQRVLYSGATVIDGTGAPARAGQDILVEGERIVAVGPHGSLPTGQARSVDLAGRWVIPGLIDTHVHMATPPNPKRAQAMLRRLLYGGVTTVRDMADDLRSVSELSRQTLVGEIPGPDIRAAAVTAGPPFFNDPRIGAVSMGYKAGTAPWAQAIDENTDIPTAITLARGTGAAAIKIYADLPADLIAKLTAEAHRQGMLVWAHSAVFPTRPADVIAAGVDVVSHACYLAYQVEPVMLASYEDHTPVNESLLAKTGDDPVIAGLYKAMLAKGTIVDATGSLFVRYDKLRKTHPEIRPLRCTGATTARLVRQAWKAGVPVSAGTDFEADVASPWPALYDELDFLAHDVGMPPLAVIHAATLVGAEAAGQAKDTGSIAAGKLANFVVLAADPVKDIGNVRSIAMTVKRGKEFARADYRPVTVEEMGNDDED
ncbi:imidazolonepropionase-like amidohydrolase [Novosphingobium sp. PhB165]|uniref:amidohydrolase family protein n=1 Tax=Novosphingobium sp. PhB165 TaxID=2485105 RepID=UPI00104ADF7F|nr:amidohydrolase family protein [Novosphingobium sp. PhB165]TCM15426.1 imidazolonepropionase-like amidohydrolase [Novosphingobium sp. PhB165]